MPTSEGQARCARRDTRARRKKWAHTRAREKSQHKTNIRFGVPRYLVTAHAAKQREIYTKKSRREVNVCFRVLRYVVTAHAAKQRGIYTKKSRHEVNVRFSVPR
ncbi:hypothetical protein NDU88_010600 [Pleurodeles waltl]|uniref:Uncharacterized protein n=1 Tax=Pleurodeles waltl TaxID=8319 RepID=A0AAV7PZC9_PLEWA|nr:hypothetical protein NDU88_010600 [Pleurodeles waltl]